MQMKKRVLSAFMALCMVCSLVGAAWAVIPQVSAAVRDVTIVNTISDDGLLTAKLEGTLGSDDSVTYTWYRSLTGSDNSWEEVQLQRVTGTEDNIVNDGQSINVAYDSIVANVGDNERYYYRVGVSVNGENEIYSQSVQVPYYIQLQNGSFEAPVIGHWNQQLTNGTEGLIWLTTGEGQGYDNDGNSREGHDIEIVRSTDNQSTYHRHDNGQNYYETFQKIVQETYSPFRAADGMQFAELNCEAYGALYQDVMTVPGVQLHWQLQHCARQSEDTMALVIMPENQAAELTNELTRISNSNLSAAQKASQIENALQEVSDPENGVYVQFITDDVRDWTQYTGDYDVPASQYLTRFFFVAVSTGSGNATVGNLLDDVSFGTTVPEPDEDEGLIQVTKIVSGDIPSDYSVDITVSGTDENQTGTISGFTAQGDGTYRGTRLFRIDIPANGSKTLAVTETTNVPSGYTETSTVSTDNSQAIEGKTTTVTVSGRDTKNVTFTNTYTPKEPTDLGLGVGKTADRVDSDGTYDLTLSVTGDQITETGEKQQLDVLFILDESNSMCDYFGYNQTRIAVAKQAIQQISGYGNYDGLSDNEALDVKYALVGFYGGKDRKNNNNKYNDATTLCNWTDNVNILINRTPGYLDDGRDDGGTNYEAGFRTGKTVLNQARNDAQKVVIFLSDGNPTYYYNENGYTAGNGSNYDSTAQDHAKTELKTLDADYFYAVGVTNNVQDTVLQELVTAATEVAASNKGYYTSSNPDDLLDAFKDIQQQITTKTYQNVVMHDVLSEYAEFALGADQTEADLQFTVKVEQRGENGWQQVGNAQTVRLNQAANFTINNKNFSITPAYNSVTGEITATFSPEYQLESGYRYSVTVQIRPTQEAIQKYNQDDIYPSGMTGDTNTGTHSGNDGFWSNTNDSAYVTYDYVTTVNGKPSTEPGKTPFPKPVIRVPDTGSLTITKVVGGLPEETTNNTPYSFTITANDATAAKVNGKTYTVTNNSSVIFANGTANVTITGAGSVTINGLPLGTYTVTENTTSLPDIDTDSDNDGDYYFSGVQYGADSSATSATATVTANATSTVTVTNTYAPYRTVTITKDVGGNMGDTTHPFNFTTSVNEAAITSSTSNVTLTDADKNQMQEGETPSAAWTENGYTLADGDILTITKLKDGDVITLKETDGNDNGYTTVYKIEDQELSVDSESGNATHTVNGNADIIVTNERNVGTPTGFFEDNLPFTLMISAAGLAGIALIVTILVRRQRRRRE